MTLAKVIKEMEEEAQMASRDASLMAASGGSAYNVRGAVSSAIADVLFYWVERLSRLPRENASGAKWPRRSVPVRELEAAFIGDSALLCSYQRDELLHVWAQALVECAEGNMRRAARGGGISPTTLAKYLTWPPG